MRPLTAREANAAVFGRRHSPSAYAPHKTGYSIISASGAELQWSESLGPLMRYIEEKRDVTIRRCKDGVTVWPTEERRTP